MTDKTYGGFTLEELKDHAKRADGVDGISIEGPNRKAGSIFAAAGALADLVAAVEQYEQSQQAQGDFTREELGTEQPAGIGDDGLPAPAAVTELESFVKAWASDPSMPQLFRDRANELLAAAPAPVEPEITPEYSQGICQDGAAILKDGQMMTIEEILAELRGTRK